MSSAAPEMQARKRRRIAHSCDDCRRRKVKCDRTTPACVRCQQSGNAHRCKYTPYTSDETSSKPHAGNTSRTSTASIGSDDEEISVQHAGWIQSQSSTIGTNAIGRDRGGVSREERRFRSMQNLVGPDIAHDASPNYPKTSRQRARTDTPSHVKRSIPDSKQALLRGSSFKTFYHGPSHCTSILLCFEELYNAAKDIMKHFMGSAEESRNVKCHLKTRRLEIKQVLATLSSEHNALLQMLPSRSVLDSLVQKYMDTCETTYRILHGPTFWKQYQEYWHAPQHTSTSFVVVLLLILACVDCIEPPGESGFVGLASVTQKRATERVIVCESWLQLQSHKHTTLVMFQIRVLLLLAKRVNALKRKRSWPAAGDLLRVAMAAGFHREPSLMIRNTSAFDQEMRRRIWATILELELATAVDLGMPSAINSDDWDCLPPSNIDDEDFDENCQALPSSKPLREFTKTTFLCLSNHSVPLRIEVLDFVNRLKRTKTQSELADLDARLRDAIAEIPALSEGPRLSVRNTSRLAEALARLLLFECLTLIHQPFVSSNDDGVLFFSRAAFRDAAASTLELYSDFVEQSEALTLCFPRNDVIRAGLCLCYELYFDTKSGNSVTFNRDRAFVLLEYAAGLLETKIMHLGEGVQAFWIVVTGLSLVSQKQDAANEETELKEVVTQRIMGIVRAILRLQKPIINPQSSLESPNNSMTGYNPPILPNLRGIPTPPDMFDMDDFPLNLDAFSLGDFWDIGGLPSFS